LRDDFQPDDTQLAIDAIGDYLLGRRTDEDPRTNGRDVTREQIGVSPLMGNKQIDPFVSAAWPVGPRCKHGASTVLQPTLQRIPCMTSRFNLSALFFAVIVGASGSAQASITDPANDFLPTYAGPKAGDLDVLTASVSYDAHTNVFDFSATFNAPVGTTPGAFYVWGLDRGQGTERFNTGPTPIGAGVKFDSVVIFQDGAVTVNRFSGAATVLPGDYTISGDTISGSVSGSLLPSTGFTDADYTWNLWPRDALFSGNASISDFAPDASNAAVTAVPEPQSYALMLAGLAGYTLLSRRRKTSSQQPAV
jgi:hypothetical protein